MTTEQPQTQARRATDAQRTQSLFYRLRKSRVEGERNKEQAPLLILLHGFGSNEDDLLGLSAYLDERFTIVSARAPYTLAPGSYAWYAVEFRQDGLALDLDQAEESRKQLIQFITEVIPALEVRSEQVYLIGFSQGAAMTASVLLTRPDLLAGAVLMSGHIVPDVEKRAAETDQLKDKPVLVVHGEYDPLLPVGEGRASRDLLQSLGLSVTYREYPMAHQVTDESLEDVDRWLSEHLNV